MKGLHILAELHGCKAPPALLHETAALRTLCVGACRDAGLAVVAEAFHAFAQGGATGAVVLAESHVAVHTWPELDAVTLDIYVCNYSQDNRAAAEAAYAALHAAFAPRTAVRRDVLRGELAPA
jgi:spermidine synthase/S-adenosylmethionine decarboxylase